MATRLSGKLYRSSTWSARRRASASSAWLTAAFPAGPEVAIRIGQDLFGTIEIDGKHFDNVRQHWFPWTMLFNMTGHPAISLPSGFGRDGLPIGLQLVGRFRADAELLRVAALFEASQDLLARWPGDPAAAILPVEAGETR